jgi:antitoxin HigA-1
LSAVAGHALATVGEILIEEFMRPMGLTQAALADAMGVQRKHVKELCNNRRNVTAATARILARVSATVPTFGSTYSGAAIYGRRLTVPASASASNARSRWARRRDPKRRAVAEKRKDGLA